MENATALAWIQFYKVPVADFVNSSGIFLIWQNCSGMDPINPKSKVQLAPSYQGSTVCLPKWEAYFGSEGKQVRNW
jgi:hypothetical protein